jgi:hypothetical protein
MEQSLSADMLEEGVAQATGRGGKVKVSLARGHLETDATRSISLVQPNTLLDNSAPHHQWGLVDGSHACAKYTSTNPKHKTAASTTPAAAVIP